MIGLARLGNLRHCVETALAEQVPGDIVEAGVWRGGACIFVQGVLTAHGATDRTIWLADSFAGLPAPDAETYPADAGDTHYLREALAVDVETVRDNFERYGLWGDNLRFLVGWFRDTLPDAPIDRISVLRCDGDLYQSTMETLESLEPKVSDGGFVIVDDYGAVPACRQATDDYRRAQGIDAPLERIDWTGVYWRVSRS
jgi:O-methyltransferase